MPSDFLAFPGDFMSLRSLAATSKYLSDAMVSTDIREEARRLALYYTGRLVQDRLNFADKARWNEPTGVRFLRGPQFYVEN